MKVRFHTGGLVASMATLFEPKSYSEFLEHIKARYGNIDLKTIACELYSDTPDTRIGWDKTFIINAKFVSSAYSFPFAFSDRDIKELKGLSENE